MEQPSLFQTAGVYAGDMELVLSIELDYTLCSKKKEATKLLAVTLSNLNRF